MYFFSLNQNQMIKIFPTIIPYVFLALTTTFTSSGVCYTYRYNNFENPLTLLNDGNRGELNTIISTVVSGDAMEPGTIITTEGAATKGKTPLESIAFSLSAGSATKLNTETAADGSGRIVEPQPIIAGSALILYAITRDESDNFKANVSQDDWSLENLTGGNATGELIPSVDSKSATYISEISSTLTTRIFYLF